MALRFHLDEHASTAVAEGLRRRGIDVTTTPDAGLMGATDLEHVRYCHSSRRVIFTHDTDFLIHAAAGIPHAGILFCASGSRSIGQTIEAIILIDACLSEQDMSDHIEFI